MVLGGGGLRRCVRRATYTTTGASNPAGMLRIPITNQSGGTVTLGAPTTNQDESTVTTNHGTFTVASSGSWTLTNGSSFTDAAGTLTVPRHDDPNR